MQYHVIHQMKKVILVPAILIDLFFIIDILLNLYGFSFFDEKDGALEIRSVKIQRRYIASSSFKVDVLAALPLDFFALLLSTTNARYQILPILRLVKIFRPPLSYHRLYRSHVSSVCVSLYRIHVAD